ncbi:DUF3613 domain-containing protein [Paraburkholderia megapolitana]|uniref:DUF3613 domain-containing protein n=1 Tax=Paraburkholderia megapolitana TaxID=420953 RepID=UPI0038BD5C84
MKTKKTIRHVRAIALSLLIVIWGADVTGAAYAQDAIPAPAVPRSEVGHAAKTWLELQRSNTAAAPAQPMLGEEAGLAYRRYMESFKSKIPDLYGSAVNQQGNGGGSGGQLPSN